MSRLSVASRCSRPSTVTRKTVRGYEDEHLHGGPLHPYELLWGWGRGWGEVRGQHSRRSRRERTCTLRGPGLHYTWIVPAPYLFLSSSSSSPPSSPAPFFVVVVVVAVVVAVRVEGEVGAYIQISAATAQVTFHVLPRCTLQLYA